MQSDRSNPIGQFHHFPVMIGCVTAALGAFWYLLGYRYSPESYEAYPITPDTVELVWFTLGLSAAVTAIVWLWRRRDQWNAVARALVPVVVVALEVLTKSLLRIPLRCYDAILFCAALGYGITCWMNAGSPLAVTTGRDESKPGRLASVTVWVFVLALGAFFFCQQIRYWNDLALGYPDCGGEASILYNTVANPRELFLGVNPQKPMFWDHFNPGIVAFVPLWLLWPDFRLLIALQIAVVLGVTVPVYRIGKWMFADERAALLLVIAWLVFPSVSQLIYTASYGFHWGNVCLPLYFIALAFWMKGRQGWALAAVAWAFLMKEEAAIVVAMFGLYLALFQRQRRLGITVAAAACAYFLLVTVLVIPSMKLGHYLQMRYFADLGQTMWEILLAPVTKPRLFWSKVFEPRSLYFAAALLAPLVFLPLRRPSILFVGLLTFVFDCLHPILKSICFHHQAALLPVIFWALAAVLKDRTIPQRRSALTGAIVSGTMLSLFLGNTFWSKETLPVYLSPGRIDLVRRIGRDIPATDSLFATPRIAAHFIKQRHLYADLPVPPDTDDALIDLQDHWRTSVSVDELRRFRDLQRQVETLPGMHLVAASDGVLLYARRGAALDARRLVERDTMPPTIPRRPVELGHGVRIEGFNVTRVASATNQEFDLVCVTTFSQVTLQTNVDLALRCKLSAGEQAGDNDTYTSVYSPMGQGIWPISRWETNHWYTDDFFITLPKGLADTVMRVRFESAALSD